LSLQPLKERADNCACAHVHLMPARDEVLGSSHACQLVLLPCSVQLHRLTLLHAREHPFIGFSPFAPYTSSVDLSVSGAMGPSTALQQSIFGPPDCDWIARPPGLQTATPSRCTTQALELEKAHDEAQLATLHEYIGHDPAAQPSTDSGGPPPLEAGSPQSSGGSPEAGSADAMGAAMVRDHLPNGGYRIMEGVHHHGLSLPVCLCTVSGLEYRHVCPSRL